MRETPTDDRECYRPALIFGVISIKKAIALASRSLASTDGSLMRCFMYGLSRHCHLVYSLLRLIILQLLAGFGMFHMLASWRSEALLFTTTNYIRTYISSPKSLGANTTSNAGGCRFSLTSRESAHRHAADICSFISTLMSRPYAAIGLAVDVKAFIYLMPNIAGLPRPARSMPADSFRRLITTKCRRKQY